MGNSQPSRSSRSFSDDTLNQATNIEQRIHAKSEEIPYNYPMKASTPNTYFQSKQHHYANPNALPIAPYGNNYSPKKSSTKTVKTPNSLNLNHLSLEPTASIDQSRSSKTRSHQLNNSGAISRSMSESQKKTLIMQGWLTKLGESSKKLKKRYWKLYDNGKLSYNTKQTGSFKKYADLRNGIDKMTLKEDTGFQVEVNQRILVFYAETKKERDDWFGIIFSHYYQKGKKDLKLLQRSSGREEDDAFNEENVEQFIIGNKDKPQQINVNNKISKKQKKKSKQRRTSFDSTKHLQNGQKLQVKSDGKDKRQRSKSKGAVAHKNGHHYKKRNGHNNNNGHNKNNTNNKSGGSKEDGRIIFSEQYMNQECDGKTCLSLERVHYVLKKYDVWRGSEKKIMSLGMYKYINNGLGEYYNNTHLLNDFNHLIAFHDNVFNHIYEYFDGECQFEKCQLIQRLHRDREFYKNDEKRKQIYYNYDDPKEINTQQILDKIHCYYRHAYDLGFRVKKSKLLSIQKNARYHRRRTPTNVGNNGSRRTSLVHSPSPNPRFLQNTSNGTEESKQATHIIIQNDIVTDNEDDDDEDGATIKAIRRRRSGRHSRKITQETPMTTDNEEDDDLDDDEDPSGFQDEWKLLEICGLIQQKRGNLRYLRTPQRINTNKFISNAGKSHRYHYWKKYDDDDDSNWLIPNKYENFKQELLSNNLYTISSKQWQCLYEKSADHFGMKRSKKIRPHKYWAELYDLPKDAVTSSFSITQSHLIAIMLYCNYDILQQRFAATFYKLDDVETDEALKSRHSNFFHFGRLLRELIECFGKKIYNKNIVFYHGITDEVLFIETTIYFHAPLSTTTSIEVAIAYSHNNDNDYLLELMDDDTVLGMARYFDCCWLSDFGNESEKFFIGGYKPLKIHTVLDAVLGRNYINYLKALHIIDEMFQGYYFNTDSDEIKQIILHLLQNQISQHKKKMSKTIELNSDLLKEIRALNKKPALYMGVLSDDSEEHYDGEQNEVNEANHMMEKVKSADTNVSNLSAHSHHSNHSNLSFHSAPSNATLMAIFNDMEMNEDDEKSINDSRRKMSRKISSTFTVSMAAMDLEDYDYFNETPKYITKLVNHYCMNVMNVCVDWTNMNQQDWKGFKFCKKLLCHNSYEWIKLSVFLTLFPNVKEINVRNIRFSQQTINNIHTFLKKMGHQNRANSLYRIEMFEVDQTKYSIADCIEQYLDKFKDIGWTLTFNPFEDEMCVLKL